MSTDQVERLISAITTFNGNVARKNNASVAEAFFSTANKQTETVFNLPITASSRLIYCLVPQGRLSSDCVTTFVVWALTNWGQLSHNGVLEPTLKWLGQILHYQVVPVKDLQIIYELFVQSLMTFSSKLTPVLCDIISKVTLTDKSLVTPCRVKTLLKIRKSEGANAAIESVLLKYQALRPDLVNEKLNKKLTSGGSNHRNGQLEVAFEAVWANRDDLDAQPEEVFGLDCPLHFFGTTPKSAKFADQTNKKTRQCLVPPLEAGPSLADCEQGTAKKKQKLDKNRRSVYLHDCKNLNDLVANIRRLKSPKQALSLIANPSTFALVLLNPNPAELQERLSMSLYYTLHNEFFSLTAMSGFTERKLDLLRRINMFQDWLQQGLPVVSKFLVLYLEVWNGRDFFTEIMKLLSYLQITDIDGMFA